MGHHNNIIEPGTAADLEVITKTREWTHLTPQQRVFVMDFLTTGNAQHALVKAYPKATVKSRRSLQWQVLRAQAVVDILEIWKWRDSREALIAIIKQQLKSAEPGSVSAKDFTVQLERLLLGVKGSNKAHFKETDEDPNDAPLEPTPPVEQSAAAPKFWIGQRVTERGPDGVIHVGIVKALDASGLPSEVEEVK